jgi:hypothetical protein
VEVGVLRALCCSILKELFETNGGFLNNNKINK